MISSQRHDEVGFEMRMTRWKNPTSHAQRVVLQDATNKKFVVTWAPGEVKTIPSEYDNAIHRVDCGDDLCHKGGGKRGGGWFCTKGHNGTIVGGLAPLLTRLDAEDTLDPSLDPHAASKKEAEAAVAAAAMTQKAAQDGLILAAARAAEAAKAQEAVDAKGGEKRK